MISIIISSANELLLENLTLNIEQTIGVPFEIISVDNSQGNMGICQVYNDSIKQARYDIFCFIHEDIVIHTGDWGKVLINIFKENTIGLVGLAGTRYKSLTPTGYHFGWDESLGLNYCNIKQQFKHSKRVEEHNIYNPSNDSLPVVACVDGVWLCASRESINYYQFDQTLIKGFHGYDLDLSFGIGTKYKVVVTFDILITHFSEGRFDKKWLTEILKVHKKWSYILPLNLAHLSDKQIFLFEKRGFRELYQNMKTWAFGAGDMVKAAIAAQKSNKISIKLKLKVLLSAIGYFFKSSKLYNE